MFNIKFDVANVVRPIVSVGKLQQGGKEVVSGQEELHQGVSWTARCTTAWAVQNRGTLLPQATDRGGLRHWCQYGEVNFGNTGYGRGVGRGGSRGYLACRLRRARAPGRHLQQRE